MFANCGGFFDVPKLEDQLGALEERMSAGDFWSNRERGSLAPQALVSSSLGQRPRIFSEGLMSAEGAIQLDGWLACTMNRAFSAWSFQHVCIPGALPQAGIELAPLALKGMRSKLPAMASELSVIDPETLHARVRELRRFL